MGTVYRKQFTKPVPAGADVVTVGGERVARWRDRGGKQQTAPLTADGTGIVRESAKWYGTVGGKPVPLCTDKQASEKMLRKLVLQS